MLSSSIFAGDGIFESKNNQLSSLWQGIARRSNHWCSSKEGQMHLMLQPKKLERRHERNAARKRSTLLVQRLRHSIFRALATLPSIFFSRRFLIERRLLECCLSPWGRWAALCLAIPRKTHIGTVEVNSFICMKVIRGVENASPVLVKYLLAEALAP
jgi:hypothetical protein